MDGEVLELTVCFISAYCADSLITTADMEKARELLCTEIISVLCPLFYNVFGVWGGLRQKNCEKRRNE